MTRQLKLLTFILTAFSACKGDKQKIEQLASAFVISCDNEKYLIEDTRANYEFSFDTIKSTKAFWTQLGYARRNNPKDTLYPYIKVLLDTPSLSRKLDIPLTGFADWRNDSRLKYYCYAGNIDTVLLKDFYIKASHNRDTTPARYKSEVSLNFYHDSISNIEKPLKFLVRQYLLYQRDRSLTIFGKQLCNLDIKQLDILKQRLPFRVHLRRML